MEDEVTKKDESLELHPLFLTDMPTDEYLEKNEAVSALITCIAEENNEISESESEHNSDVESDSDSESDSGYRPMRMKRKNKKKLSSVPYKKQDKDKKFDSKRSSAKLGLQMQFL